MAFSKKSKKLVKNAGLAAGFLGAMAAAGNAQDDGKDNVDFKGKAKLQLWDHTLGAEGGTKGFGAFGIWDNHFPYDAIAGYRSLSDSNETSENSVSGSGAGTTFLNTNFNTKDERTFYGSRLSTPEFWGMKLAGNYYHFNDETTVRGNGTIQIPAIGFTDVFNINERIETDMDEYGLGLRKRFEIGSADVYKTLDLAIGGLSGKGKTEANVMQTSGAGTTTTFTRTDRETLRGYLAAMIDFSEDSYGWFRTEGDRIESETGTMKDVFKRYEAELGLRFPLWSSSFASLWGRFKDEEGMGEADGYEIGARFGCGIPSRVERRHKWASIMNEYLPEELRDGAQDVTNRERDLEAGTYWALEPHYFRFGKTQGGSIDAIYQKVLSENHALHIELGYGRTATDTVSGSLDSDIYRAKVALVARDGWSLEADVNHVNTGGRDRTEFTLGVSYSPKSK